MAANTNNTNLVGIFKRFGAFGPVYKVMEAGKDMLRISVIDSGEELDYPYEKFKNDPQVS